MADGATASQAKQGNLGLLVYVILVGFVSIICTLQQITTTHDSALGLLQGGVMVPSHMTGWQVQQFLNQALDKDNKIAYTIAFVTQAVFLGALMPYGSERHMILRRIVAVIFFVLEVTSDLWYASATGTTIGGAFTWILNLGGGGWLVTIAYIAAMSAGSTLVLIDFLHKAEILLRGLFHRG